MGESLKIMDTESDPATAIIREAFNKVDRRDPQALRKFFLTYSYFTANDLAMILKLNARTIRGYRCKAGIRRSWSQKPPGYYSGKTPDIEINWNDSESIRRAYQQCGIKQICKLVKRNRSAIIDKLRRLGLRRSQREICKSKHPCCTVEWLRKHYVEEELSQAACAKLAGVSGTTIRDWLNFHGFRVRTLYAGPAIPIVGKNGGIRANQIQNSSVGTNPTT